jgi:hypothetical protein
MAAAASAALKSSTDVRAAPARVRNEHMQILPQHASNSMCTYKGKEAGSIELHGSVSTLVYLYSNSRIATDPCQSYFSTTLDVNCSQSIYRNLCNDIDLQILLL